MQALEQREVEAIPRRKDELNTRVATQKRIEREQQECYKGLVDRRDELRQVLKA